MTTFEIKNKMEAGETVDTLANAHNLTVVCTLGPKEWIGRCKTITAGELKKMGRGHFPITKDGKYVPVWVSAFMELLTYGGGHLPSATSLPKLA